MKSEPQQSPPDWSEDQRAVHEYFQSDAFRETSLRRNEVPRIPFRRDGSHDVVWWTDDRTPTASFLLGLVGLNVILIAFACLAPVVIYSLEPVISRNREFFWMLGLIQTTIFPPLVSFSFATVTPMFWYGSVLVRFLAGILLVVPGCLVFYFMMGWLNGSPPDDFAFAFAGVMFTQFLVAGTVALIVQMWSPWTLTHARDSQSPLPPLGMLAMMELTGVAAIGCAVFLWEGFGDILEGILFFAGMGGLSSLAVIAALIALLRDNRRNRASAAVAVAAAFGMAFLLCSFFAIQEFGWDSITWNVVLITVVAAYGAAVIAGVMWLCVGWLRFCGWRCVNRRLEKLTTTSSLPA